MSGVKKFEHATLYVTDIDEAIALYRDTLGLAEIDRSDGVVYLGCGFDENYDIGLIEGGTGVEHFAIRMANPEELAHYASRLRDEGIDLTRTDRAEPNQVEGVRFTLPSGIDMELVTVADTTYHHPARPKLDRPGFTPRDVDHIHLMSYDVDADLDLLLNVLDFSISDKILSDAGFITQVWTRFGAFHHDVSISFINDIKTTLHHLGFEVLSMDHMKRVCDHLADTGYELEMGPNRHNAGACTFAYVWSPGGNRIELTGEMATLDEAAPPGVRELMRESNTVSSWGGVTPPMEFLERGS